jgi:hypothetical protein
MNQNLDIAKLLSLRTVTTAVAEYLGRLLREHIANLAPLLHPRSLLGDLIRYEKCGIKQQDVAFQALAKKYQQLAQPSSLNLLPDLKSPLDIFSSQPDLIPASYRYTPENSGNPITTITPLKWVLIYKDLGPQRLRELLSNRASRDGSELQTCILHYLVMSMLVERQPGIKPILEALRFSVDCEANAEFKGVPIVYLSFPLTTTRPPDTIILQSTQISGSSTFEEVLDASSIASLTDPLKEQLLAIAGSDKNGIPKKAK